MKPQARKSDLVVRQLGKERLIYDLKANKAFCLNETSTLVLESCDGTRSISEISNRMSEKLEAPVCKDLVKFALDQFGKDGLIEGYTGDYFVGLSRREVIRRTGFASVIALTIVSSIIAPKALMAQSVCVPGAAIGGTATTCTSDNECAECNCLRRNPVDGTSHCCVAIATGVGGTGAAVNPGGFVDCVPNDAGGMTTCSSDAPLCCNGSTTFTGLQGVCPAASQSECRCVL